MHDLFKLSLIEFTVVNTVSLHAAPPTPTNVIVKIMNASSVRVVWQWSNSGSAPSCFNTTTVTYHPEGCGESSLQLSDPAANKTILTGLKNNTCYTITVVATAGEHRRESVARTVYFPLQGMLNSWIFHTVLILQWL